MTTKAEIELWFDNGIGRQASYLVVMCDTFDWEDYPVYCRTADECLKKIATPGSMQKVMEVYDLSMPKVAQMEEHRAWHPPKE